MAFSNVSIILVTLASANPSEDMHTYDHVAECLERNVPYSLESSLLVSEKPHTPA